jgi:hypothetical protein
MVTFAAMRANAGRTGGPLSIVLTAPGATSMFYDIPFNGGERAVVSVVGDGTSALHVILYDADGHAAIGNQAGDRQTVAMDVYRAGMFRLEMRNLGTQPNVFLLTTN